MSALKNSLRNKIVFRCDAANSPKVGTGHLLRCLNLAKHLSKKYNIQSNKIIFICKTNKEYFLSKKILLKEKFILKKISNKIRDNSTEEAKNISKNASNLLVIDRISKTNSRFYKIIKKNLKKLLFLKINLKLEKNLI